MADANLNPVPHQTGNVFGAIPFELTDVTFTGTYHNRAFESQIEIFIAGNPMRLILFQLAAVLLIASPVAGDVVFDWAVVGNPPGNAGDPQLSGTYGAVDYTLVAIGLLGRWFAHSVVWPRLRERGHIPPGFAAADGAAGFADSGRAELDAG